MTRTGPSLANTRPETGELSRGAVQVIDTAHDVAEARGSTVVEPPDLLVAVLAGGGAPVDAVRAAGVDPAKLRDRAAALAGAGEGVGRGERLAMGDAGTRVAMGDAGKQVVYEAIREARLLGHQVVDPFHLLLALSYRDGGPTAELLADSGVNLVDLRMFAQGRAVSGDARSQTAARQLGRRPMPRFTAVTRPSPYFLVPVGAMVLGGLGLWYGGGQLVTAFVLLFVAGGWVASLCIHEFSHALAGYVGGDREVARAGYLTLNPLRYTHPVLSLGVPLLFLVLGGIGLPGGAVFINRGALRSRGWDSFVAAAGPLGSLACLLLFAWPFVLPGQPWADPTRTAFWSALALLCFLELTAIVFNLIPLPPLDGFGIIAPYLSPQTRLSAARLGFMPLLLLFAAFYIPEVNAAFFGFMFQLCYAVQVPPVLVGIGFELFPRLNLGV